MPSQIVLKGGSWLIGSRVARVITTIFGTMILARILTPADFGVSYLATALILFAIAVIEGFVDYPITRADHLSDITARSLLWTSTIITALFVAALCISAPSLEMIFNFSLLTEVVRGAAPAIFIQGSIVTCLSIIKRNHDFRFIGFSSLANVLTYVVTGVLFAISNFGFWSLILAQVSAQFVTAVLVFRRAGLAFIPPRRMHFAGTIKVGAWGGLSRIISFTSSNIDTLFVSLLLGPASAGLYNRAYNINTQVKEPFAAIDQAMRQAFAVQKPRNTDHQKKNLSALRLITLASGFCAGTLIISREYIVAILLGPQWTEAAWPLAILAMALPVRVARMWLDSLVIVSGNVRNLVMRNGIILLATVAALLVVADEGISAIAGAVTGALYFTLILPASGDKRIGGTGPLTLLQAMAPGLLVMVVLGSADQLIAHFDGIPALLVLGIRVGLVVLVGVLIFLLPPNQWFGTSVSEFRARLIGALKNILGKPF